MSGYPWSELGLDGPADERTIRRAYAARLKIVRPDVDAAGFQRLVEARNIALRVIEHTALRPLARPPAPANPAPTPEPAPDARPSPQPPPATNNTERAAPVDIELSAGLPPAAPQPPTAEPLPIIVELRPPQNSADTGRPDMPPRPAPIEIELSTQPAPARAQPQRPSPRQLPPVTGDIDRPTPSSRPTASRQPPDSSGPAAVGNLLSAFVEAWGRKKALPPVEPILALLSEQSIAARQQLEAEALRTVVTLLDKGLLDRKTQKAMQKAARSLIVGLDDDYQWSSNDRRLHLMMPTSSADQVARLLRVVREWERTGTAPFAQVRRQTTSAGKLWTLGLFFCVIVIKGLITWSAQTPPRTIAPPIQLSYSVPATVQTDYAAPFFRQGVAYDAAGQFDRAIMEYDQAIRLNPGHAQAFYNRGLDYANKGQLDRAIQDYDIAIRLNPRDPNYFISRGVAYDAKAQYDRAIQDYDQAIRLKPDSALAFVDRGIAYANSDRYDRAIEDYDRAIAINPNDPDALYNRGEARRARGDIAGGDDDTARAGQLRSPPSSLAPVGK